MNWLFIVNPGSHAGRSLRRWERWEHGLRAAGIQYRSVQTAHPGHAFALARDEQRAETVIAVGGDGTINEVIDGLLQSPAPARFFGVLYAGTSPDFCRFHGIPTDMDGALNALLHWQAPRGIDVARITLQRDQGEVMGHFACSCNIGLGAAIARDANRWRRYLGDIAGTGAALLRALCTQLPFTLELEIDGVPLALSQVNHLSVVKNPYIASGLRMKLPLQRGDGQLMLVAICGRNRLNMLRALPACYSGNITSAPGVLVQPCRQVRICATTAHAVEFDGDPQGMLPVSINLLPRALSLIGGAA